MTKPVEIEMDVETKALADLANVFVTAIDGSVPQETNAAMSLEALALAVGSVIASQDDPDAMPDFLRVLVRFHTKAVIVRTLGFTATPEKYDA